jgi:hypothetical protein
MQGGGVFKGGPSKPFLFYKWVPILSASPLDQLVGSYPGRIESICVLDLWLWGSLVLAYG